MPRLRHGFGWNASEAAVQAVVNDGHAGFDSIDALSDADDVEGDNDVEGEAVTSNEEAMRDCLSELIIQRLSQSAAENRHGKQKDARRKDKTPRHGGSSDMTADADDLSEFVEFLAEEIFSALPLELQTLTHKTIAEHPKLAERYGDPLPPQTLKTLVATAPADLQNQLISCGALDESSSNTDRDLKHFLDDLYSAYVARATVTPVHAEDLPLADTAKAAACELCERDWVPLTVHHLIPREIWAKAVKRGWIADETEAHRRLAWLCRACHNCVHRSASNLELARSFNTVEALWERQNIRDFAAWVGKVRWKKT